MNIQLSKRLDTVRGMVPAGMILADIGTDHGYIPIVLTMDGTIPGAIAMDINKGPLERADEHIREAGLEGKVSTRLSDGMAALAPGEAQTAVIAGMGGALTARILGKDAAVTAAMKTLVLEPQSEVFKVRAWLWENGWVIDREDMLCEDGKYYPVIRAVQDAEAAKKQKRDEDSAEAWYGPLLLEMKHPVLRDYLEREYIIRKDILSKLAQAQKDTAAAREAEVKVIIDRNRKAFDIISG